MDTRQTGFDLDIDKDKVRQVRKRLDAVELSEETAYKAFAFSLLTANAKLPDAEAAYGNLIEAFPTPESLRDADKDVIQDLIRQPSITHNYKSGYILGLRPILTEAVKVIKNEDPEAARWFLAKNVPGLGMTKASFALMLLGVYEVACLDTHICQMIGVENRNKLQSKSGYEKREDWLRSRVSGNVPVGLAQWVVWCDRQEIPAQEAHNVYFRSL